MNHQQAIVYLKNQSLVSALFFTEEGIVVDRASKLPLLPCLETIQKLNLTIEACQLDNNLIIIKGKSDLIHRDKPYEQFEVYALKSYLAGAQPDLQMQIIRAYHWLNWDEQSQFCGHCATRLTAKIDVIEKKCLACKRSYFPRFSPAVMVIIYNQNKEIILARSKHFTPGVYSAIAGFIDLGETAELAVHREVKEELNIQVTNLSYFSSQVWPFPDSFMIAFKAEYLSGEICIDPNEIEDAKWFKIDNLPPLPSTASIAYRLIMSLLAEIK